MTWFKVDDGFHDHPKMLALRKQRGWERAVALWTLAGAWCAGKERDGFVPSAALKSCGGGTAAARMLVEHGLWEPTEGGYLFCGWLKYNPSKEQLNDRREKTRERVQEWRRNGVTKKDVTLLPSRPVPSEEEEEKKKEEREKRGERASARTPLSSDNDSQPYPTLKDRPVGPLKAFTNNAAADQCQELFRAEFGRLKAIPAKATRSQWETLSQHVRDLGERYCKTMPEVITALCESVPVGNRWAFDVVAADPFGRPQGKRDIRKGVYVPHPSEKRKVWAPGEHEAYIDRLFGDVAAVAE